MYTRAKMVLTALLVLAFSGSIAFAQEYGPASGRPAFAQRELDQMLAPIALYPDALLSQILMASTYPAEVVEAARWSRRYPGLDGDRAVRAVERMDWDPSVKSLVAFPQILTLMDEKLDWTERLGDAFYAQQADVMDTVQYLRQKAYSAGNLGSTDLLRVDRQGQAIVIELTNPGLIHVPHYNPTVVYGTWWWPTSQPVYWAAWPGYHAQPGLTRGVAWGPAIRVSSNFFFGATDWHRRSVHIVNVNNYYYHPAQAHVPTQTSHSTSNVWRHNPAHRRDVPYRHASLLQKSGHASARKPSVRGPAKHQPATHRESTVPASQPSDNIAASVAPGKTAVPRPAGKSRDHDGSARRPQ